jgi:hypothetical protein
LNVARLREQLETYLSLKGLMEDISATRPHLFSSTVVFIASETADLISATVAAIERVAALPAYQAQALSRAPTIAQQAFGPLGACMGVDFHLGAAGPQLIEINTNAGGLLLNSALARAQEACCQAMDSSFNQKSRWETLEPELLGMFQSEWRLQRGNTPWRSVLIVDDDPSGQYLAPEFALFQQLFRQAGVQARLADPRAHAVFADKRNLIALSQQEGWADWGASPADSQLLQTVIPRTELVTAEHADALWARRRHLFFKPVAGFRSKAAYRGDKLTRRVWGEILAGDFVAQALVPPSERLVEVDGVLTDLKFDLRAYCYAGQVQLLAARMYAGQTTNFRTQGGGFAPVMVLPPAALAEGSPKP